MCVLEHLYYLLVGLKILKPNTTIKTCKNQTAFNYTYHEWEDIQSLFNTNIRVCLTFAFRVHFCWLCWGCRSTTATVKKLLQVDEETCVFNLKLRLIYAVVKIHWNVHCWKIVHAVILLCYIGSLNCDTLNTSWKYEPRCCQYCVWKPRLSRRESIKQNKRCCRCKDLYRYMMWGGTVFNIVFAWSADTSGLSVEQLFPLATDLYVALQLHCF